MYHSNWLRNSLPSDTIKAHVETARLCIHLPLNHSARKKVPPAWLPRLLHRSAERDDVIPRLHPCTEQHHLHARCGLQPRDKDVLPDVARLLDGITCQRVMDEANQVPSEAEKDFARKVVAFIARAPNLCLLAKKKRIFQRAPSSFTEASNDA